ncbi:MAG: replicative DNA helicase, partial [Planctomycetales bacterium]
MAADAEQNASREKKTPAEILDRLPPQSLEAEQGVLGSILLNSEVCDEVVLVLDADDFYADAHRRLFRHLKEMNDEGLRIDSTLLHERLKKAEELDAVGGIAYLAEVANSVPHAANATYYAQIVAEKSTLRSLIHTSTAILRDCYDPTQESRDLLSQAEERIFSIFDRKGDSAVSRFDDVMHLAFDRIDARLERGAGVSGLATGFIDLDKLLGGFQKSELLILAARPSMGKTALAANIAEHVSVQEKACVLFVSLEMSKLELAERILCSFAEVNGHHLRNGNISADSQQRVVEKSSSLSHAALYIDDSPSRKVSEIAAIARRLKRRENLGLIIIDYLQLIDPDNPRDPRQEQVARIARRLKGLARSLEVPLLCLAQLNRQAETSKDNLPRLTHLRESGAIEQDADVVMFIHREEYYATKEEIEANNLGGKAEVIVAKQRNGPTDTVKMAFHR